ncbi:MAG TPA: putative sulfate exporter family transporter [Verrucomicrobiae bacterium]
MSSGPVALLAGAGLAWVWPQALEQILPPTDKIRVIRRLLQSSIVLLGFSMDLSEVWQLGQSGLGFAAGSIGATFLIGLALGKCLGVERKLSLLIAAGTAICGGSAIAAVGMAIMVGEADLAMALGVVFFLNGLALFIFPWVGQLLHLSQSQFGWWAGVAIHDVSSVVGAGMRYGPDALKTATTVKLARSLWIIPVTLMAAAWSAKAIREEPWYRRIRWPWFIACFLLASLVRTVIPAVGYVTPGLLMVAKLGMVGVLFLVGNSLSLPALRRVGWRPLLLGGLLWGAISAGALAMLWHMSAKG